MSAGEFPGTLVVGGGLAGAAAAIRLRMAGQKVRLWERERGAHHKVCGEFLSREGLVHVAALGIDVDAMGAVPITAMRLVGPRHIASARLGFTARSVTRRTLDEALLEQAAKLGAEVCRGVSARGIGEDGTLLSAHGDVCPAAAILATGKHNLRGRARAAEGTIDHLVGFKTYWRLAPQQRAELAGHTELILFRGGYAGLQMVERDMANLCFLVDPQRHALCGGHFDRLIADLAAEVPHLARRLDAAVPLLDRPLAISGVPYGFLMPQGGSGYGLWPVGDQAGVIPSFTGMGMSLALHGAALAVRALLAGEGIERYRKALLRDVRGPIARATRMQRVIEGSASGPGCLLAAARAFPLLLGLGVRTTRLKASSVAPVAGQVSAG
jgi:flavin-dependent dehydrogenase